MNKADHFIKRVFDIVFSLSGILVLLPVYVTVAILVRQDKGPALFRQKRVGQYGEKFTIYKFRTMFVDSEKRSKQFTTKNDTRITRVGQVLRQTKLDELPQLLNVFQGTMSFVGPRPEVLKYVDLWTERDKQIILSVKPGITDYATLHYNDEQKILGDSPNPEKAYFKIIVPNKIRLYKRYISDRCFALDVKIIVATLMKIFHINVKLFDVPID